MQKKHDIVVSLGALDKGTGLTTISAWEPYKYSYENVCITYQSLKWYICTHLTEIQK
jgi:hypothetical protein